MAYSLWELLERHMAAEGISPAELSRRSGIAESQFSPGKSIRRGNTAKIDPDTIRALHRGTGIPLVDLIVAAGMWTAEELQAPPPFDPATLTNAERLALVAERLRPDDEFGGNSMSAAVSGDEDGYSSGRSRGEWSGATSRGQRPTGRTRPRPVPDPEPESKRNTTSC